MSLYSETLAAIQALDDFDAELVLTHDLAPVVAEMSENDAERPAAVVIDAGMERFPREIGGNLDDSRAGRNTVEVRVYYPVTDDPEQWEEDRLELQANVETALVAVAKAGLLRRLTGTGWRPVLLDGTATPSYTRTTFRLTEEVY